MRVELAAAAAMGISRNIDFTFAEKKIRTCYVCDRTWKKRIKASSDQSRNVYCVLYMFIYVSYAQRKKNFFFDNTIEFLTYLNTTKNASKT